MELSIRVQTVEVEAPCLRCQAPTNVRVQGYGDKRPFCPKHVGDYAKRQAESFCRQVGVR